MSTSIGILVGSLVVIGALTWFLAEVALCRKKHAHRSPRETGAGIPASQAHDAATASIASRAGGWTLTYLGAKEPVRDDGLCTRWEMLFECAETERVLEVFVSARSGDIAPRVECTERDAPGLAGTLPPLPSAFKDSPEAVRDLLASAGKPGSAPEGLTLVATTDERGRPVWRSRGDGDQLLTTSLACDAA